jgi:hypothetical protein
VQELRDRIVEIQNYRIAQIADGRKYQSQVNKLSGALNRLLRRGTQNLLTPREQALMDKQDHVTYADLKPAEQQKLKAEIDMMWGQIPEHLQEKAQRLAGLR